MTRDRIRKGSVSLIAILLIVILMALPTGYEDAAIYKGTDRVRAKVLSNESLCSGYQYFHLFICLELTPYHLVNNAYIALDDLDNLS